MTNELVELLNTCIENNPKLDRLFKDKFPVSKKFAKKASVHCEKDENGKDFTNLLGLINATLDSYNESRVAYSFEDDDKEEKIIGFVVYPDNLK